ncbi:YHYH domain-containing protein [Sinorhizobium sp. RAC02]
MKVARLILALMLAVSLAPTAFAHSGGTDANGCHRDNKRGGSHCH